MTKELKAVEAFCLEWAKKQKKEEKDIAVHIGNVDVANLVRPYEIYILPDAQDLTSRYISQNGNTCPVTVYFIGKMQIDMLAPLCLAEEFVQAVKKDTSLLGTVARCSPLKLDFAFDIGSSGKRIQGARFDCEVQVFDDEEWGEQ